MCANVIKAYGIWEGVDGTTKINDLSSISFGKITVSFIAHFSLILLNLIFAILVQIS